MRLTRELGQVYLNLYEINGSREYLSNALSHFVEAKRLMESFGMTLDIFDIQIFLATCYSKMGDLDENPSHYKTAKDLILKSLVSIPSSESSLKLIPAMQNLGIICFNLAKYENKEENLRDAKEYLGKSEELFKEFHAEGKDKAITKMNLANIFNDFFRTTHDVTNLLKCIKYREEAREYFQKEGYIEFLPNLYKVIGKDYFSLYFTDSNNPDRFLILQKAIQNYENSLKGIQILKLSQIIEIKHNLGVLYGELFGRTHKNDVFNKSRRFFLEAIELEQDAQKKEIIKKNLQVFESLSSGANRNE